jgi:hypothetical protein
MLRSNPATETTAPTAGSAAAVVNEANPPTL